MMRERRTRSAVHLRCTPTNLHRETQQVLQVATPVRWWSTDRPDMTPPFGDPLTDLRLTLLEDVLDKAIQAS